MKKDNFASRHIGPALPESTEMLQHIGVQSVDELINQTVPQNIRLKNELHLPEALSEFEYAEHIQELAAKNKVYKSYIGLGYYNTITPAVIKRNILENPGWYTAYTPYQAEISQGRMEALLNFQTMVCELSGMEIANASLLDEGTAAAEAMAMFFNNRSKEEMASGKNKFFVSSAVFPHTIDVLITRANPIGIEIIIGDENSFDFNSNCFGVLLQYPGKNGEIKNHKAFAEKLASANIKLIVAADIMSLALLVPPGEWGADAVVGNTQRFGVPMGFGGPHAAFFATKEEYKRSIPGRIIGVSVDRNGNQAYRMALQTREQHIRRDKATSNICTAQALLAIMASMYAVYHGATGLKQIALDIHNKTQSLVNALSKLGFSINNENYFDTVLVETSDESLVEHIKALSVNAGYNFRYNEKGFIGISLNETTNQSDINKVAEIFAKAVSKDFSAVEDYQSLYFSIDKSLLRTSPILTHPVFNMYHSETEMMRYIKRLESKDISLANSMISLGSCTMKLNAASELFPISMPAFANIHPFVPAFQAEGYLEMIKSLEKWLCEITGFAAMSFQPNSGAQGEYAGLMVIRQYHISRGNTHRNIALIPSSAHGTNPASAVMCGMQVVVVKCDENGNIDINDLRQKAETHKDNLAALMVTYPSTHGVFEEGIIEITKIIHQNGGQVYMDGANMNAQVGLTNPASIGADVCHLNLHKTFAIPHGGGGPGVGPIGVAAHLAEFLPGHCLFPTGGEKGIHAVSSAPFGSASILLISYGYIAMLGATGVKKATEYAILNANYIKQRLSGHYPVLYVGKNNRVAHEMIIDCREFKRTAGIEVEDIAKRLIDYGFHAPTVSFPVAGTIMIEPTESENKHEMDRFCDALIAIRNEIAEIESGKADAKNNVLKNAPHTGNELVSDTWQYPYTREKAGFPLSYLRTNKYWPNVARVDNAYGDRNLICTCPPLEEYETV